MYRALLGDDVYWRRQFEKPADYVAMKLMAPNQTVGIDAQVAASTLDLNPLPRVNIGGGGGGRGGRPVRSASDDEWWSINRASHFPTHLLLESV